MRTDLGDALNEILESTVSDALDNSSSILDELRDLDRVHGINYLKNVPSCVESDYEDFVKEIAEEEGLDLSSSVADYVEWDRYGSDLRDSMTEVSFDGETYLTYDA